MGPWIVLLVGLLFVALFGVLSFIRKEPLSIRFAVECLGLTALAYIIYWATRWLISPIAFLLILYLVTMRAQILVDLGTVFARRGSFGLAKRLYEAAQRMGTADFSKVVARINIGSCLLKEKRLEEAIQVLRGVAVDAEKGLLAPKHEAACRYNLGLALMRSGKTAEAVHQLNLVEELLPASIYGVGAKAELKRYRQAASAPGDIAAPAPDPEANKPKQEA